MARMQRTQIYLEPDLAASLDRIARERSISRAELIREAARRFVGSEDAAYGSILQLAGLGHGGPGNVSERHDEYLADEKLGKHQV